MVLAAGLSLGLLASPPGAGSPGAPQIQCGPVEGLAAGRARVAVEVRARANGAPLEGARVYLSDDPVAVEGDTDAAGIARFAELPAGEYLVMADQGEDNEQVVLSLDAGRQCLVTILLGAPGLPADAAQQGELGEDMRDGFEGELAADPELVARWHRRREQGQVLRGAGIGVLSLGVALGIGSALSWITVPCGADGTTSADCRTDTRTQLTVGFAVAGGLTVAGGVALIAVGVRRMRRPASLSRIELRSAPWMTRHGAGIGWTGRF